MTVDSLLTFDHAANPPTSNAAIVRDDEDALVAASRSRNADREWEVRGYSVWGAGVRFRGLDVEQANLAAVLVELFDGDDLATNERYTSSMPIRYGVPVVVATDGKPAVAAWLRVRGRSRDEIAETMDVNRRTIREYLSRLRTRGDGIDVEAAPAVGEIVETLPASMDYSGEAGGQA